MNAVIQSLVQLLLDKLGAQLIIHGTYVAALDTVLIAKNGTKMIGVQKWKDHSGNADRGERLVGHHWGIIGLISFNKMTGKYRCWLTKMCLICGTLNPFHFVVDPEGTARRGGFQDGVIIFLSTDLSLSATQIIELYSARFSIELAIRDTKQYFGLADYQCYVSIAIERFVNLACLAYSLFGLFQQEQDNVDWMPAVSPACSQWSFARLRQGLQHFGISRILFPKSTPGADLLEQSPELANIFRLTAQHQAFKESRFSSDLGI